MGSLSASPKLIPEVWPAPGFWHRLIRFRHVISGSLALASLNRACRNLVPDPKIIAQFDTTLAELKAAGAAIVDPFEVPVLDTMASRRPWMLGASTP